MSWYVFVAEFLKGVGLGFFYTFLLHFNKWSRLIFYSIMLFGIIVMVFSTSPEAIVGTVNFGEFVSLFMGLLVGNVMGRGIVTELKEDWSS